MEIKVQKYGTHQHILIKKIRYLQHMLLKLLLELVKHLRVCQNIRTKKDEN